MRISDLSSDVFSSDLGGDAGFVMDVPQPAAQVLSHLGVKRAERLVQQQQPRLHRKRARKRHALPLTTRKLRRITLCRSEEHTSELQSLMRISYAVFCLKKKKKKANHSSNIHPLHK